MMLIISNIESNGFLRKETRLITWRVRMMTLHLHYHIIYSVLSKRLKMKNFNSFSHHPENLWSVAVGDSIAVSLPLDNLPLFVWSLRFCVPTTWRWRYILFRELQTIGNKTLRSKARVRFASGGLNKSTKIFFPPGPFYVSVKSRGKSINHSWLRRS